MQKRIRRQKSAEVDTYIPLLRQLLQFLSGEPLFVAIQTELMQRFPDAESVAETIIKESLEIADKKNLIGRPLANEEEWAAVSLGVLRRFSALNDSRTANRFVLPQASTAYKDYLSGLSDLYLTPFYEYLDERLDDPQFILGQLVRFKHLCEWFWRNDLFRSCEADSKHGEKTLAMKLYEFLFTEGIHVHIEPWSASGEADMVGSQEGPEPLIADAKVFNPDKGKSTKYILQGFRQTYQYTVDHNEAVGYLIIFNTSKKQLRFAVTGSAAPLPRVVLNHKTIFFLVIDLYPHETSASKRPQPEVAEITEADILGEVKKAGQDQSGPKTVPD
ncbi:MAG: hypothetical protein WAQ52_08740 [Terriglobales bacterium]